MQPLPFKLSEDRVETLSQRQHDADTLRKLHVFIRDNVIARRDGRLPDCKAIGIRLVALSCLLEPDAHSLRAVAAELKCSPAWLTKVAYQFSDHLGLHAQWQRIAARGACRERQLGVHAGTHTPMPKWERRKLRERRRKEIAA